jgi:hypothetical protein
MTSQPERKRVNRRTVDLAEYPNLVMIILGMRVNAWTGIKTLLGIRPKIVKSVSDQPEGLLHHEMFLFSLFPPHAGMRQYWRDFESLETWARSQPHRDWWQAFLRSSRGTGFWHETYSMRGGIEAVYDDMPSPVGMMHFAPIEPAHGPMFTARQRLGIGGEANEPPPVSEDEAG